MGEVKKNLRRARQRQIRRIVTLAISVVILGVLVIGLVLWNQKENLGNNNEDNIAQGEMDTSENLQDEIETVTGEPFTMFFTGDVMLQNVMGRYDEKGINGIISEYLEEEMVNADMTMINNEFSFSTRGEQAPDKQFTFRVHPRYVSALQDMGVDVASLANNHALDFGTDALLDSFTTLDEAGIPYVGAGETTERAEEAVFVEANGRKVGVLSASRVIPVHTWNIINTKPGLFCTYDSARIVERIKEIEDECDYVVVFVHWGIEREAYPEEYQRELAHQYIDAGADLVVGNHAHVPQGIEYYKGVPIVYCLGNYIFNPNMVDTYALKAIWDEDGTTQLQVIPVDTRELLTAELAGEERQAFFRYLENISAGISIDDDGMVTYLADEVIVNPEAIEE